MGDTLYLQQPPLGIDPQNIYKPPLMPTYQDHVQDYAHYPPTPTEVSQPKPTTNYSEGCGAVYGAVYSGVPVYEMVCRNVAVMRRQKDSYLNATQVLKVAQIEKGKRTKILEKEIQNREHEKVQGGYGKYQGTWIPFARGVELARLYGVDELLKPLLEYVPPNGRSERTPTKEQVLGPPPPKQSASQRRLSSSSYQPEKRMKMDPEPEEPQAHNPEPNYHMQNEVSLSEQFFDFHDAKNYYNPYTGYYNMDPYMHAYHPPHAVAPIQSPVAVAAESSSERHRSAIMALFLNNSSTPGQEAMFLHSILPSDFDIDLILDEHGHTALHWAAALANINLLSLLIQKGAQVDRLNYSGESALIRSIMVTHNYDRHCYLELLAILKDIILIPDKKNRNILHHICLTAETKAKSNTSIYYMQCLLEFIAKSAYDEAMSSQLVHTDNQTSLAKRFAIFINTVDICGDTAVNIAARLGSRALFDLLVESGADVNIPNYAGLRPVDFGFEANPVVNNPASRQSACVVYPSIQTEQETTNQSLSPNAANSEKSKDELIAELKNQLNSISREITEYRKEIEPLRKENAIIPELKAKIQTLEKRLSKDRSQSVATVPNSSDTENSQSNEEIARLRLALAHQKNVEAHLCQELVNLRSTIGNHEMSCKKIIAACCNISLEHIDELVQPLLETLESDDFSLDLRLISGFLSRIRTEGGNAAVPADVPSDMSDSSTGFLM